MQSFVRANDMSSIDVECGGDVEQTKSSVDVCELLAGGFACVLDVLEGTNDLIFAPGVSRKRLLRESRCAISHALLVDRLAMNLERVNAGCRILASYHVKSSFIWVTWQSALTPEVIPPLWRY